MEQIEQEIEQSENTYLQQVMDQKFEVERDLKAKRSAMPQLRNRAQTVRPAPSAAGVEAADGPAVDVRITGFWRWKNVIVPPNAYVVHTRRGHDKPIHIGLGQSFRFNPLRDSFLVVPAAMQTIIINANSICRERQGILVQGYVQWIIENFDTAYRKLDFSDLVDPMRVVNVQLREQAEAAIKDTVASMGIDDVLADKQPIIKELTARLRQVAEGDGKDEGLGLRIATIQIKEAVISSSRVWESLQRPFRAERSKEARLAELTQLSLVRERETAEEEKSARLDLQKDAEIARLQAETESKRFDREQTEKARRAKLEAEMLAEVIEHERKAMEKKGELDQLRVRLANEIAAQHLEAERKAAEVKIGLQSARRKVENEISPAFNQQKLIELLPEVIGRLPKLDNVRSISLGGTEFSGLVDSLKSMLERVGQIEK